MGTSASAISRRTSTTRSCRSTTRSRSRSTRTERNFSKTNYIPEINLDTTSGQTFPATSHPGRGDGIGNPGYPELRAVDRRRHALPVRSGGVPGRRRRSPTRSSSTSSARRRYQINADWQAYLTGLYSQQETRFIIQPMPLSDQIFTTATRDGRVRHHPAADEPVLSAPARDRSRRRRAAAQRALSRRRVRQPRHDGHQRGVADRRRRHRAPRGTGTWSGTFNYSQNTTTETLNGGFPLYSTILPLLNSGAVNLFGPNTPDVTQQIQSHQLQRRDVQRASCRATASTSRARARSTSCPPARSRSRSACRRAQETLTQNPNPLLQTGDVAGYGGNLQVIDHSRTVWAVFAELNIPIVEDARGERRGALRPLQRFRQHDQPEVEPPLAAGAVRCCSAARGARASSRRRSTSCGIRRRRDSRRPASQRSAALSGSQRPGQRDESGLQHAVHGDLRRQSEPAAGEREPDDGRRHLGAGDRRLARRRLVLPRPQESREQRRADRDDPRPGDRIRRTATS